jgi:membrane protein DedA with SNARE-associated domain
VNLSALSVYAGVFAALVAAGVGFPMPEELPIVTAGAFLGQTADDPPPGLYGWALLLVCIAGVVLSDLLLYLIGRLWGLRLLRLRFVAGILPGARLQRIRRGFARHGVLILLVARLLPGIRTAIFLSAGIIRLPWKRFLLADGLYALPGVSLLFLLAYWFTDRFRDWVIRVEEEVSRCKLVLLGVAVAAGIGYWLCRSLRRKARGGQGFATRSQR